MIGDADWAVFADPDDFGTEVDYVQGGASAGLVEGIFSAPHREVLTGFGPGASTTDPTFTVAAAALPTAPEVGDTLTATQTFPGYPNGTTFRVADLQPDGTGLVRLILEKV